MQCTKYLVKKQKCSALELSTLCGHWAWLFTLRTEFYSLFQEVYFFIGKHKDLCPSARPTSDGNSTWAVPFELPPEVLAELRSVTRLAPLLFANLGASPDPEVLATDACGYGEIYAGSGVHHRPPARCPN